MFTRNYCQLDEDWKKRYEASQLLVLSAQEILLTKEQQDELDDWIHKIYSGSKEDV